MTYSDIFLAVVDVCDGGLDSFRDSLGSFDVASFSVEQSVGHQGGDLLFLLEVQRGEPWMKNK